MKKNNSLFTMIILVLGLLSAGFILKTDSDHMFDYSDSVKLGRQKVTKSTSGQSGRKAVGFNGEYGLQIFNEGNQYLLKEAAFHMRFNTLDSILFRINIYDVQDGKPGRSILDKEIYTKAYKKDNWIRADLSAENLVMDQNLVVTYQVVEAWFSKRGDNQMFFTHGADYMEGGFFGRSPNRDEWTTSSMDTGVGPVVLYLSAEKF
ncbi:MAG: hypothetical protein JXR03_14500 [Cyclobacteriaceae bacterium]